MPWSYERSTVIDRPPEQVFDYCSDLCRELEWNPDARSVEKLTAGPVGLGTRYQVRWSRTAATLVEVVRFDPPHAWETASSAMGMDVHAQGLVEHDPCGARYTVGLTLDPRGLARLFAPLALVAMRRQEVRNMERIKQALERADEAAWEAERCRETSTDSAGGDDAAGARQAPTANDPRPWVNDSHR